MADTTFLETLIRPVWHIAIKPGRENREAVKPRTGTGVRPADAAFGELAQ